MESKAIRVPSALIGGETLPPPVVLVTWVKVTCASAGWRPYPAIRPTLTERNLQYRGADPADLYAMIGAVELVQTS